MSPTDSPSAGVTKRHDRPDENPIGLDGFEFVEFTGPDPEALAGLFVAMGFTHVGNHRSKNVRRYAQGDINFLLNMDAGGQVADFREAAWPLGQRDGVPGRRMPPRR